MEKEVYDAYLYDFYGELLNAHQRRIFEASRFMDLSLSEIGEEEGISRQGVHDSLKRTEEKLLRYEEKLRLVARFLEAKKRIRHLMEQYPDMAGELQEISDILFKDEADGI